MSECKCHFCGESSGIKILASVYLPVGESVCMDCYSIGRMALDNCSAIKFDTIYDDDGKALYIVYKTTVWGDIYLERAFIRRGNAFRYLRKLAEFYLD